MEDKNTFDEQNWLALVGKSGKLLSYAVVRVRTQYRGLLVDGVTAEMLASNVVSDTIEAVYSGRRHWNREAYPNFDDFLFGVIDSLLSNRWKTHKRARQDYIEVPLNDAITASVSKPPQPLNGRLTKLIESWGKNPIMASVIEGLQDGLKPAQISQKYSLPMRNVRQCIQNLKRRITGAYSRAKVNKPWKR